MHLAVYISGHGFGHLAQVAPVLDHIQQLQPDCYFLIRCALPESEIRNRLSVNFTLDATPVDVGVVQHNAIEEDQAASIQQMRIWLDDFDAQLAYETALLRSFNPKLIISDISPLAFPVARALNVPSIGLATLDWHSIYSHWLRPDDAIITTLKHAYQDCDLLLTPPMAMDMPVFPQQQNIGLIAPVPQNIKHSVFADPRKKALVLFGGCGNPPYDVQALADMSDWLFLIPSEFKPDATKHASENVQSIQFNTKLQPIDLMPHVDVVLCKPGYGVLSECWCSRTPIAWVERPDFPEFPMLQQWLEDVFPACGMSRADFKAGAWQHALDSAHLHTATFPKYTDGALEAATIIVTYASTNGANTNVKV